MIRLGPAGSPMKSTLEGLGYIKKIGLSAMEVEFTYGVRMQNELAEEIGKLAEKLDIKLSVHAPYYINLASAEKQKIGASKKRILDSCERAHYLKASHVVFHAGFYGKLKENECYEMIKKEVIEMQDIIKENKWKTELAPETTGKKSQFGSLNEILKLRDEIKCSICVDFAHLHARDNAINYPSVFDQLSGLKHIHSHFSGIEFTDKGERRHLVMERNDFLPLAKEILKRKTDITIISESPVTWEDSLKMKNIIETLKNEKHNH
ncbi:endonuclease IV [Candidatus Woesearchaeota archaeon CG_4_10_14_0_2_um_filter_33_10]|nr:MAG: endonuclease IV [Candidatus Woesearchaeota archaeon CG1_02_33_12]PIU73146.1 MAG: endonuclease IV [Candidatus Woesearchaeota archaeon CG06_land_8_20_14_3_00_33_13]PIZ53577.1 MAG: endonuclease IV [Candidatus Woesearchaeota archaeon CG_4_10_14_0_2_um_filter_33_10]